MCFQIREIKKGTKMIRNYAGPGLLVLLVAAMFFSMLAQPLNPAIGQGAEAVATPQATPTSGANTSSSEEDTEKSPAATSGPLKFTATQSLVTVGIFLVLILLLTAIVIVWLNTQSKRDHDLRLHLQKAGKSFTIGTSSPVFVNAGGSVNATESASRSVAAQITGPTTVVVGKPAEFLLKTDDTAEHTVTWSLKESATGVIGTDSNPTRLVATNAGKITVVASVDNGAAIVEFEIEAIEPKSESQLVLPNSVVGWGTLLLTILILCFAALIGLLTDHTAVVLTLFGTMAGYAFGVTKSDK